MILTRNKERVVTAAAATEYIIACRTAAEATRTRPIFGYVRSDYFCFYKKKKEKH